MADLPLEKMDYLKAMRTKEILGRIRCDVRRYDADFKIDHKAENIIAKYLVHNKNRYDEAFYQQLENELSDYFGSDRADLIIDNVGQRQKIVKALIRHVRTNANNTEASLQVT